MTEGPERPDEPRADERTAEGTGETVGEAKWAALRALERRYPGLDKGDVSFAIVSEGERGILGVGYEAARVVASAGRASVDAPPPPAESLPEAGSPEARAGEVLTRICEALGVSAGVSVAGEGEAIAARLSGPDLGLLIGKHGQTIDAIQYLVNAIVWRDAEERREIVVDAAGYRERRRSALERAAERAARDALRDGRSVALEPMTSVERKIVHVHLRDRPDVETSSEGAEPNRHVVVRPAGGDEHA